MNYGVYRLKIGEALKLFLEYLMIAGLFAYLFYDSFTAFCLLLPGLALFIRKKRKELIVKRKKEIAQEFKDMILAVSTELNAGYSLENSFREAYRDMLSLYGETSLICTELREFFRRMEMGDQLERMLADFADRTEIDEIKDFAEIFSIAKRSGGNLSKMIHRTVTIMREKDETEREIEVLLSGKKFEQKIMGVIPLIIILYLKLGNGGFLKALYHNLTGTVIMSACLSAYVLSYVLAEKIVAIEV